MDKEAAKKFLESLLNRQIRVHTTDERLFWGEFKCTDPDRNLVLHNTFEYRQPSAANRAKAAAEAGVEAASTLKMDMLHRYLGLVVVPGEHIVKIEKEDIVSELKQWRHTAMPPEAVQQNQANQSKSTEENTMRTG